MAETIFILVVALLSLAILNYMDYKDVKESRYMQAHRVRQSRIRNRQRR